MRRLALIVILSTTLSASANAQAWTCSAPGMQSGTYNGGATAYIHLSAYPNCMKTGTYIGPDSGTNHGPADKR